MNKEYEEWIANLREEVRKRYDKKPIFIRITIPLDRVMKFFRKLFKRRTP